MENIDEKNRKPRRTKGTPSYYYRNRFAAGGILAGCLIFALWTYTPIHKVATEKFIREYLVITEEEKDRKFTFNFGAAPRTARSIQESLDEKKKLFSER
ncbi:uncharacterized protein LOC106094359 [Stomoxys calcitrans]|uniref:Uncharacterized protein n=1 Tax=Stomoxys calcitrans TaxID=35570 RepID=A0A1I8Q3Z0_STOCA|nr:uncharacterized protein LOC106094359 [Stomoxys calcitrans]